MGLGLPVPFQGVPLALPVTVVSLWDGRSGGRKGEKALPAEDGGRGARGAGRHWQCPWSRSEPSSARECECHAPLPVTHSRAVGGATRTLMTMRLERPPAQWHGAHHPRGLIVGRCGEWGVFRSHRGPLAPQQAGAVRAPAGPGAMRLGRPNAHNPPTRRPCGDSFPLLVCAAGGPGAVRTASLTSSTASPGRIASGSAIKIECSAFLISFIAREVRLMPAASCGPGRREGGWSERGRMPLVESRGACRPRTPASGPAISDQDDEIRLREVK